MLITTLSTVLVVGCSPSQKRKVESQTNEVVEAKANARWETMALKDKRSQAVLLREVTPYDSDSAARKVYLTNFYAGYRLGRTGTSMSRCLFGVILRVKTSH